MDSRNLLEALDLAIANKACITGLLGVGAGQSCRDIQLELTAEQSSRVYVEIKSILYETPRVSDESGVR